MSKHPAVFTDAILPQATIMLARHLEPGARVLDPFAGTGKGVEYLRAAGFRASGIELEPEWGGGVKYVIVGDATHTGIRAHSFDAVFTSPCYGNRMADKDMRPSVAGTYAKALGRFATDGSACHLQWGEKYREFHEAAWTEARRVLVPGGVFLLNIKDHYRGKQLAGVPAWHRECLKSLGFAWVTTAKVNVPSLRVGANSDLRVEHELLVLMRAPS